jgi:hypothetical protein
MVLAKENRTPGKFNIEQLLSFDLSSIVEPAGNNQHGIEMSSPAGAARLQFNGQNDAVFTLTIDEHEARVEV